MLEKLSETQSLWDYLKGVDKPILLYGMGDGALKIMKVLKRNRIPLAGIFASDEYVRGHSFEGFLVERFSTVKERYGENGFVILLAFAVFREPLLSFIYQTGEEFELYAPDVPVCAEDEQVFDLDYLKCQESKLDRVYELLADDLSRQTLIDVLNFKISGKISYLKKITSPIQEVYETLFSLHENEDYVDLGAYTGDTIEEFLHFARFEFSSITALEPDPKNFKKLQKRLSELGIAERVRAFPYGSYSRTDQLLFAGKAGRNSALSQKDGVLTPVDSVDHLLQGARVTLLKMDVEGAEEASLRGAKQTIQTYLPKMMISSYHKNSDLFLLPLLIEKFAPGKYQYYLRHHPYIPAWETNYYLVGKGDNRYPII